VRLGELVADPSLDITPPITEVAANPEAGRSSAVVSPGVDGGDRDVEVMGELLGAEQRVTHPM